MIPTYVGTYDLVNINRCHLHSTLHSTVIHRLLIAVARPVLPLWLLHQSPHHPPPTLITNRGTFRQVGRMGLIIIVNQLMTDRPRDTVFSCLLLSCLVLSWHFVDSEKLKWVTAVEVVGAVGLCPQWAQRPVQMLKWKRERVSPLSQSSTPPGAPSANTRSVLLPQYCHSIF